MARNRNREPKPPQLPIPGLKLCERNGTIIGVITAVDTRVDTVTIQKAKRKSMTTITEFTRWHGMYGWEIN